MPNGCKTFIKNMEEEEAKEAEADKKKEKEGREYENIWEKLSTRTLRMLRYDGAVIDKDGWERLSTLKNRGLTLTKEKMQGLCEGKGGGGKIRFETIEQMGDVKIRLLVREEREKRKYTSMAE